MEATIFVCFISCDGFLWVNDSLFLCAKGIEPLFLLSSFVLSALAKVVKKEEPDLAFQKISTFLSVVMADGPKQRHYARAEHSASTARGK